MVPVVQVVGTRLRSPRSISRSAPATCSQYFPPRTQDAFAIFFTKPEAMSLDIDYFTVFSVMDSWESLRRLPNSDEVAGTILFKK
jgi:hypothetical protein